MVKALEMAVLVANGADHVEVEAKQQQQVNGNDNSPKVIIPRGRSLSLVSCGLFLVCAVLYFWNAEIAGEEVAIDSPLASSAVDPRHRRLASLAQTVVIKEKKADPTKYAEPIGTFYEGIFPVLPDAGEPVGTKDTGECPALCDTRDKARKTKFGGDLLDFSDVKKMAEKGRDNLYKKLRVDYGSAFDKVFFKPGDPEPNTTKAYGMTPTTKDRLSLDRLKRKLQIKVLKMMKSLKTSDERVHGCNCITKKGSPTQKGEDFTSDFPKHYERYVFANGGHSNAAGHGNRFSETYTAYLGQDLRMVWDTIGVEMVDRNMGQGAQRAAPDIAACSKEIFGTDVDLLAFNYAMTDPASYSWKYYVARAAASPGRPVHIGLDTGHPKVAGPMLERHGLAIFQLIAGAVPGVKKIPDSAPGGLPLTDAKANDIAPLFRYLRCNGKLEGKGGGCFSRKWSCTADMRAKGIKCECPDVAKRSSWHMGYRMHALTARFIGLPIVELLIEGISEMIAMDKDPETILTELKAEEDKDYEAFSDMNITAYGFNGWGLSEEQWDYHMKGPSICRTSLLPSMTRYLGIASNSDKVGGTARFGEETYELGIPLNRKDYGIYTFTTNHTPPPGEFSLLSPNDLRKHNHANGDCKDARLPDYKDWFGGNWSSGSASVTFPNEKEKKYYGYEPGKFKGILGLIPTLFGEGAKPYDIIITDWKEHVGITVNGQPVTQLLNVRGMTVLGGADGIYWKPSKNNDYVLEFTPIGERGKDKVINLHLRIQGFLLM